MSDTGGTWTGSVEMFDLKSGALADTFRLVFGAAGATGGSDS
jgi:hypothetical protein